MEHALTLPTSLERLVAVVGFAMSPLNSQVDRDGKPFNPLLGETFEWQAPNGQHRHVGRWEPGLGHFLF